MFDVVKFVSEVDAERFSEYYYTHNNKDVCRELSIKKCQINKVLSFLNLSKKTKEQINAIISGTLLDKTDEDKKKCAVRNGFNLIRVWDWDDLDKVISIIAQKEKIFAIKCCIKELDDVDDFLNSYHLHGSCKGQSIKK